MEMPVKAQSAVAELRWSDALVISILGLGLDSPTSRLWTGQVKHCCLSGPSVMVTWRIHPHEHRRKQYVRRQHP